MNKLDQLAYRLESVNFNLASFTKEILEGDGDTLLDLLKMQLFEGKQGDGNNLRPLYSEDLKINGGYFNSPQSAARYAQWKQGLNYPYSVPRDTDAPNLFVNGALFHNNLGIVFDAEQARFVGTTAKASEIMAKYGYKNFGLMDSLMETYNNTKFLPRLKERIIEYLQNG